MYSLPLTVGMCHFNWMQSVPTALFKASVFEKVHHGPSLKIILNNAAGFCLG